MPHSLNALEEHYSHYIACLMALVEISIRLLVPRVETGEITVISSALYERGKAPSVLCLAARLHSLRGSNDFVQAQVSATCKQNNVYYCHLNALATAQCTH